MTNYRPAPPPERVDYTIPEGCPACDHDLPVRVSAKGPIGVCTACGWIGRPTITVTHEGLRVTTDAAAA